MRTVTSPSIKLASSKSVRRTFWPLSLLSTTIALNVGTYPSHSAREPVPFTVGACNLARDFLVRHHSWSGWGLEYDGRNDARQVGPILESRRCRSLPHFLLSARC